MNAALWAAAATGVQVGAAIVASRQLAAEVPPFTLALLRYGIGLGCLLPWVLPVVFKPNRPAARFQLGRAATNSIATDLVAMAALGIGQFGVLIALLNAGLRHVAAAPAALVFSLFPLLTLLLAAALGRERLRPVLLVGVLLSVAGVALSLAPKLAAAHPPGSWLGELAVLAAAATGALCSVLYRPYLRRYPTVPVSAYAMAASVLFLLPAAWAEGGLHRLAALGAASWWTIGFIGVSSGAGYVAWLYALKHESPTRVTVFLALNPATAAVLGWAWLGEPLSVWLLAALPLIALGLWLATRGAAGMPVQAEVTAVRTTGAG